MNRSVVPRILAEPAIGAKLPLLVPDTANGDLPLRDHAGMRCVPEARVSVRQTLRPQSLRKGILQLWRVRCCGDAQRKQQHTRRQHGGGASHRKPPARRGTVKYSMLPQSTDQQHGKQYGGIAHIPHTVNALREAGDQKCRRQQDESDAQDGIDGGSIGIAEEAHHVTRNNEHARKQEDHTHSVADRFKGEKRLFQKTRPRQAQQSLHIEGGIFPDTLPTGEPVKVPYDVFVGPADQEVQLVQHEACSRSKQRGRSHPPVASARAASRTEELAHAHNQYRQPADQYGDHIPYTYTVPKKTPAVTDEAKPDSSTPDTSSGTPYVAPKTVAASSSSDTGAKLILSNAKLPAGVDAKDVSLSSRALASDSSVITGIKSTAAAAGLPTVTGVSVLDLNLVNKNGSTVKFDGSATVVVAIPDGFSSFVRVFFVDDNGNLEEVPAVLNGKNLEFTVKHFSHYALVDFAASAGTIATKLTASTAPVSVATTAAATTTADGNATSNPKTGAAAASLSILALASAGIVVLKARKK